MKDFHFSMFISIGLILLSSCEQLETDDQSSSLQNRSDCVDECSDCPVDDCCCSITLTEGNSVALELCGTTDPCLSTITCGPVEAGNCMISGYTINFMLTAGSPTQFFCVAKNSPFYILAGSPATARITCRVGLNPPQGVTAVFNTPPNDKAYYTVNGDCEIASCF